MPTSANSGYCANVQETEIFLKIRDMPHLPLIDSLPSPIHSAQRQEDGSSSNLANNSNDDNAHNNNNKDDVVEHGGGGEAGGGGGQLLAQAGRHSHLPPRRDTQH